MINEIFRRTIESRGMISPGDTVLCACSGGPDSMALFHLLVELKADLRFELAAAHFHHGLRPEADEDETFVRAEVSRCGVRLIAEKGDVAAFASANKMGLEEAGRRLRYEFLRRAAAKAGASKIATGHNMNDQAETVLMRIIRGTGLTGLAGIPPVSEYEDRTIIRPLIEISREEIVAYLRERGLPFRTDRSNLDRRFLRNRVRHELLPEIESRFGGRSTEHLARLAGLVWEEEQVLADFIRSTAGMLITGAGREAGLNAGLLDLLPRPAARRIAREFLREVKGDLGGFSMTDVDRLVGLAEGREAPAAGGFIFRREKGRIALKPKRQASPGFELSWDGRNELRLEAAGAVFRARVMKNPGLERLDFDDRQRAFFDLDAVGLPLAVRNRLPGDRYKPLGSSGRKKVKEMLRARGVPAGDRSDIPVFLSGTDIIWIPGLPTAENFRVRKNSARVLLIEMLPSAAGGMS